MITSIRGRIIDAGPGYLTFELNGLGVRVEVPGLGRAPKMHTGDEGVLNTAFLVREDSMTLYGFETIEELEVFQLLMKVSGVGPRSALGVLSSLTPAQIAQAADNEDEKAFKAVSGIGPKTAKLIIISLAGKITHLAKSIQSENISNEKSHIFEVVAALVGLGWPETQAKEAAVAADAESATANSSQLLRAALLLLQTPKR